LNLAANPIELCKKPRKITKLAFDVEHGSSIRHDCFALPPVSDHPGIGGQAVGISRGGCGDCSDVEIGEELAHAGPFRFNDIPAHATFEGHPGELFEIAVQRLWECSHCTQHTRPPPFRKCIHSPRGQSGS
jgi:hypothetical protein